MRKGHLNENINYVTAGCYEQSFSSHNILRYMCDYMALQGSLQKNIKYS